MEPLEVIAALKKELLPSDLDKPVTKMKKSELLEWFAAASILPRMRIYYMSGDGSGIPSRLTAPEAAESIVPSDEEAEKWRVGKLRKLYKAFIKDLGLKRTKFDKLSRRKLQHLFVEKRYDQILNMGQDFDTEAAVESVQQEAKNDTSGTDLRSIMAHLNQFVSQKQTPSVVVLGQKSECSKCASEHPIVDDDPYDFADPGATFLDSDNIIARLAPNLYRTLTETALRLDIETLTCRLKQARACCDSIPCRAQQVYRPWSDRHPDRPLSLPAPFPGPRGGPGPPPGEKKKDPWDEDGGDDGDPRVPVRAGRVEEEAPEEEQL